MGTEAGRTDLSAGARALSIFSRVLSAEVLRAHLDAGGPLTSAGLEELLGWAPQASLRAAVGNLRGAGALERVSGRGVATELSPSGRGLLEVVAALEAWLSQSPFGALELSGEAGRGTVRALAAGWEAAVVRALAARPRSLAELSGQLPTYSYPALKRRVAQLRGATLVACVDGDARSPAYEPTSWLRSATGPLSAAARWELRHATDLADGAEYDLGTTLMLTLPVLALPSDATGACLLAAPSPGATNGGGAPAAAGVGVVVKQGEIVALRPVQAVGPGTWALGSTGTWLDAFLDGRLDELRIRGAHVDLATHLIAGIHRVFSVSPDRYSRLP